MVRNIAGAAIILAVAAAGFMPPAQAQVTPATGPATKPPAKPTAPAELPGKGLAQH